MAKIKKPAKRKPFAANATLFAYYMQAIEPTNEAINKAFPDFHPMWVIQSQRTEVSGQQLKFLRQQLLKITEAQCAAYLRISLHTLECWEHGYMPVPFMAVEMLRLVYASPEFHLSDPVWEGWFIHKNGRLVSPDTLNLSFTPSELTYVREIHQQKSFYETEHKKLRAEVDDLRAELAEVKAINGNDGLLDELQAIEARLAEIAVKVGNNNVVSISSRKPTETTTEVKVA